MLKKRKKIMTLVILDMGCEHSKEGCKNFVKS